MNEAKAALEKQLADKLAELEQYRTQSEQDLEALRFEKDDYKT